MAQPPDHDVNSASLELQPDSSPLSSPKTRGVGLNNDLSHNANESITPSFSSPSLNTLSPRSCSPSCPGAPAVLRSRPAVAAATTTATITTTSATIATPLTAIMPFEASTVSDSGTEADGEYFLRGLPAPKVCPHKGLRGEEEPLSGVSTPLLAPPAQRTWKPECMIEDNHVQSMKKKKRRSRVLVRRVAELGVVVVLTGVVIANEDVAAMIKPLTRELAQFGALYTLMLCVYPLRYIMSRTSLYSTPILCLSSITIPLDFDPAPFLYPPVLTLLTSFLVSSDKSQLLAPNIVLAISTIPRYLVPFACYSTPDSSPSSVHWLLSLLPLLTSTTSASNLTIDQLSTNKSLEILSYLYPFHQSFCVLLYSLTTTSLLPAELELLSVALINILLFAESPQIKILRALIWVGGFLVLLSTGNTILKGIALARVPKWRFRRDRRRIRESPIVRPLRLLWNPFCLKRELLGLGSSKNTITAANEDTSDSSTGNDYNDDNQEAMQSSNKTRVLAKPRKKTERSSENQAQVIFTKRQRRTLSVSLKPLLKLTPEQAMARKWLYAGYVYACIVTIIIFPVRLAISRDALNGHEAIGWAMGYLFGDVGYFRWQVVSYKLNDWIILPPRVESLNKAACCGSGWVQNIRLSFIGVSNTRLLLAAYWLLILVIGLLVVFRLSAIYEVDTRRKVFHFMMVAMMLPSIFVDACFCAMALSFALAIFLLLDLLRASQLPPLSKPIATFLAPYVDGRDFKGPVVVSHIFLLIGCAIPLWLSLASQSRAASDIQGWPQGWELPARHVSMVAGVVCVGLGDAAASLVGRRYGRHKWYWGGGKSLEGSIAFALAVCAGLMAASAWMRIGGWPVAQEVGVSRALGNSLGCGSLASLTEAVLTGGNDNVIVPVVLWMCVKSIGV